MLPTENQPNRGPTILILWMEEILHHLGWLKPNKYGINHHSTGGMSSIHSKFDLPVSSCLYSFLRSQYPTFFLTEFQLKFTGSEKLRECIRMVRSMAHKDSKLGMCRMPQATQVLRTSLIKPKPKSHSPVVSPDTPQSCNACIVCFELHPGIHLKLRMSEQCDSMPV